MRIVWCVLCAVMTLALSGMTYASAPGEWGKTKFGTRIGAKAGFLAGSMRSEDSTVEFDLQHDIGFFFDIKTIGGVLLSPGMDMLGLQTDYPRVDEKTNMIHPHVFLKYHIVSKRPHFAFRPGIGVGHGMMSGLGQLNDSEYWTFSVFVETVIYTKGQSGILLEINHMTTSGGDRSFDLQSDGIWIFRTGFLF